MWINVLTQSEQLVMCFCLVDATVQFKDSAYYIREGIGLMHSQLEFSKEFAEEITIKVQDVEGTATGKSTNTE